MALNSGALNSHTLNGAASPLFHFSGRLSDEQVVSISQVVVSTAEIITVTLTQRIFETGSVSVGLTQEVTETIYTVSVRLAQEVYGKGTISTGLTQTVFGTSNGAGVTPAGTVIPAGLNSPADERSYWTAKVILKGVDVSANLTGIISVDNEESSASIAAFTIKPTAGLVDLTQWVRAPVTVWYTKTDSIGAVVSSHLLFNGFVDVPNYDATTKLTTFSCTDELQKAFEGLTVEQIDAIVAGFWSGEVFEEDTDKWSYALDRLSTIPYSLNYDVNRVVVKTPWAAKVTADFLLNEAVIVDGSISVSLANSREITNHVQVSVNYGYEAFKARQVGYVWKMFPTVESGDYSPYGWAPVFNSMIIDAATQDSWVFAKQPFFTAWPETRWYKGVAVVNTDQNIVVGAQFRSVKRYQQSVEDGYSFVLKSDKSIDSLGKLGELEEYSITAEYSEDVEGFEETEERTGTYRAELNTVFSDGVNEEGKLINPVKIGEVDVPFTYTAYVNDYPQDNQIGEIEYDLTGSLARNSRADLEGVIDVVQNLHKTKILDSHRGNSVSVTTLIEPNITRESTVRIETAAVVAQGKVRQVEHILNITAGSATSEIVLGVSRSTAIGVVDVETPLDSTTQQADVLSQPTDSNNVFDNFVFLGNYVERIPDSNQLGDNAFGMQAFYNETEFLVNFPEISTENAQTLTVTTDKEFTVEVPNEDLTLNA